MTSSPFQDAVALDTNIFEQLLNPQENKDGHINVLLGHLQQECVSLLLDRECRIKREYTHRITPILRDAHERLNEAQILRYWLEYAPIMHSEVNLTDELMSIVSRIILENEAVDRILVYVALRQGKILVSNDHRHIVDGPSRESSQGPRRNRLLRKSRRKRPQGGEILTSLEAFDWT